MADDDRLSRWNERYARGADTYDYAPSPPLAEAVHGVAPGRALDLACGAGRHALYLAERGWEVVAVDFADAGLGLLAAEAQRRGVASRIEIVQADLGGAVSGYPIAAGGFDLVCDFYFLERARFPEIRAGVRPGGLFVAAIHTETPAPAHRFLLAAGELRAMVAEWGWEILLSREGEPGEAGHHHATAELVARRPR